MRISLDKIILIFETSDREYCQLLSKYFFQQFLVCAKKMFSPTTYFELSLLRLNWKVILEKTFTRIVTFQQNALSFAEFDHHV